MSQLASKPDLDSAVAAIKRDIDPIKVEFAGKFTRLYWLMGANLGISFAVLWRLVR